MSNLTPQLLLERITASETSMEYTYIITGKIGPTGKSWLYRQLNSRGYNVIDLNESLMRYCHIEFDDSRNHYVINEIEKLMVIILNERLEGR